MTTAIRLRRRGILSPVKIPISLAQAPVFSTTGATSPIVLTLGSAVTAGSLLVIAFGGHTAAALVSISSITDASGSNVWVKAPSGFIDVTNTGSAEIWYCEGAAAGSYAVTVNYGANPARQVVTLGEFVASVVSQPDQQGNQSNTTSTSQGTPSLTPTVAGELFIASVGINSTPNTLSVSTASAAAGWTAFGPTGTTGGMCAYLILPVASGLAAQQCIFTESGSSTGVGAAASFFPK